MMKADDERVRKVEEALIRSYRKGKRREPGDAWQQRVMSCIRQMDLKGRAEPMNHSADNRIVWRFAAAASLAAIVVSAYMVDAGFNAEYEIARLLVEDLSALDVARSFGIM